MVLPMYVVARGHYYLHTELHSFIMQTVFVAALEFGLSFLEASVQKDPSVARPKDQDFFTSSSSSSRGTTQGSKEEEHRQKLQAAYDFMGLSPEGVTQEQVKKRYKQLSLQYHPDRNGGSAESQAQMQKLNACLDIIEKDLLGVNDQDNHQHDEDHENEEDDESPMERYMRMREEMQKEVEAELARQQKAIDDFEANKQKMQETAAKRTKELGLDTQEGRERSHDKFANDVREAKSVHSNATKKQKVQEKPHNISDIDEDEPKACNQPQTKQGQREKPKYELMEYGETSDEVILALRMGTIPADIILEFLQKQLQEYFQEESQNMHFEGVKKTPRECRLEFLLQPRDDDMNTIMHYAAYFESLQVIQSLCQVALKDRQLASVLEHMNIHGETVISFAAFAEDSRLTAFLHAQEQLNDHIQKHTELLPALRAVPARISSMAKNFGLPTIISTCLLFIVPYTLCGLRLLTSLVALILVQTVGRATAKNVVDRYSNLVGMLWSFCGLWLLSRELMGLILEVVMVELLLILAPIVIAGVVSSRNRRRRGGVFGLVLLPLEIHAKLSEKIEPVLTKVFHLLTPKMLKTSQPAWILPYYLSLSIFMFLGAANFIHEIFGTKEEDYSFL
jgi:hypothetical protein